MSVLSFRGLPGSQELNQQLANVFTEKVEHSMHISQCVLGHIGYLQHASQHPSKSLLNASLQPGPLRHCLLLERHLFHTSA